MLAATVATALLAGPARAADAPVAGVLDALAVTTTGGTAGGSDALIRGNHPDAGSGSAVAFAGDFNGDRRPDYVIGEARRSEVDVVFGGTFPEPGPTALVDRARLRILGYPHSNTGWSVAGAGDVNGDGYDDVLIGSPALSFTDRPHGGAAWLVYGGADPNPASLSLRVRSPRIVRLLGAAGEVAGSSVARLGDIDGDGRPDLAVGAGAGNAVYVVYSGAIAKGVDLAAPGPAAQRLAGAPGEGVGLAVAGAGDMNGDGRGEVVVGARRAQGGNGAAFVVFGKPAAAAPVNLDALGADGFTLLGTGLEAAGWSVAGLGDATGDGVPDIAVGAPYSTFAGRTRSGAVYVVPGRAGTAPATLPSGLRIGGGDPFEHFGVSLATPGDVDGDGRADLVVGREGRLFGTLTQPAATLALTGRLPAPDADEALLGYAGMQIAGPAPVGPPALGAGADAGGDGRGDVLLGFPKALGGRGQVALVGLPAAPVAPEARAPVAPARADDVEAVIDDSGSMRFKDPDGLLRREALELMLVNPANAGRIFGAVEFGTFAHQLLAPLRIGDDPFPADRLAALRAVLAARIRNDGGETNFALGFAAAAASNPGAQARIFITDGGQLDALSGFGDVPTYVIGLQLAAGPAHDRLVQLAHASGGEYFAAGDAGQIQAVLAAIDAQLRGDLPLSTTVAAAPGVSPEADTATPGEAAAKVTRAGTTVDFSTTAGTPAARSLRRARMVISWNTRRSAFRLTRLQLVHGAGARIGVPRRTLRRALRGHRERLAGGVVIRGRTGRTFIVLDVRGIPRGRGASAAAQGWGVHSRVRRFQGRRTTVVRSLWTYQQRPH